MNNRAASLTYTNGRTPPSLTDVLPHNIEAEEATLGAILIDSEYVLSQISNLNLTAVDFYREHHGWIFDAVLELHRAGKPADLVMVRDILERRGQLAEIPHLGYLSELINQTPTATHGPYYARIVKETAHRRRLIEALTRAVQLSYDTAAPLDSVETGIAELLASDYTPGQEWEIFNLADAYKPRPPLQWAVEGLFALPSLSIIYGAPGTMKSLLAADMLVSVSAGLDWLPPLPGQTVRPRKTSAAPVLWLDFDNGRRITHERFEALGRAAGLSEAAPVHYASMPTPWLDASDYSAVEALARRVERLGAKVVVIDNLGTVSGGVDENSPEMIRVMSNLRRLADTTGAAIVVIHHQRKANGFKGRSGDMLRGHSSIEAALDLALLVERKEGVDWVSIKSTKTRNSCVQPFDVEFTYEHKPGSNELAEGRFFGLKSDPAEDLEAIRIAILECARKSPGLSQTKLKETVKDKMPRAATSKIRDQILMMTKIGLLKAAGDGGTGGPGGGGALAYFAADNFLDR